MTKDFVLWDYKEGPRWPQDGSKMASKMTQDVSKTAWLQDGSKLASRLQVADRITSPTQVETITAKDTSKDKHTHLHSKHVDQHGAASE